MMLLPLVCGRVAVTHKLNVSEHMLIRVFLLDLVCGTRAQSLSATFSYTFRTTFKYASGVTIRRVF
jgi:hypothetical protein